MDNLHNRAESFQSTAITMDHIRRLQTAGYCMDTDPMQLSADLWGYLNLSIAGAIDKVTFDNAPAGNRFDAWRRGVAFMGPRSEARLHNMHKDVTPPVPSSEDAWVTSPTT